jgi:hypothetical protein
LRPLRWTKPHALVMTKLVYICNSLKLYNYYSRHLFLLKNVISSVCATWENISKPTKMVNFSTQLFSLSFLLFPVAARFKPLTLGPLSIVLPLRLHSQISNCDKFYFTFEFEYQMWVQIFKKFEKDWIPICHLSD